MTEGEIVMYVALIITWAVFLILYRMVSKHTPAPAEYVKGYKGWCIYRIEYPKGYDIRYPSKTVSPFYIATNIDKDVVSGIDLPDVEAGIDEAML